MNVIRGLRPYANCKIYNAERGKRPPRHQAPAALFTSARPRRRSERVIQFCGVQATFSVFIQSRDYGKASVRRSMATSFSDAADAIELRAARRIPGGVALDTLVAGFKTSLELLHGRQINDGYVSNQSAERSSFRGETAAEAEERAAQGRGLAHLVVIASLLDPR